MNETGQRDIRQARTFLMMLVALFVANAALWIGADLAPKMLSVRSSGFAFPAMAQSGVPVRSMLFAGLMAACGWMERGRIAGQAARKAALRGGSGRWRDGAGVTLAALVFVAYLFLSYPPQISLTNFRILWVDWLGSDLKIRYAGQILRDAFYGYPHVLQACAGLVTFLALRGIALRLGFAPLLAGLVALASCVSSIFLQFSGVGEDWLLATAASVACIWVYAERKWAWLAVVLVVLASLRLPAAMVLLLAIAMVEMVRATRLARRRQGAAVRIMAGAMVSSGLLAALVAVLAYLAYLHFAWYGDDLAAAPGGGLEQREVDGFVLTRFSGAYVAHAVWALPPIVLASCVASAAFFWRLSGSRVGRIALVSALAMGGTLLSYEVSLEHQFYYNYRYLALAFPLGLPAVFHVLRRAGNAWWFVLIAMASILFSSSGNAWVAFTGNASEVRWLDHEMYSCRRPLSPWLAPRRIFVEDRSKSLSNAISYVKGPGQSGGPGFRALQTLGSKASFGPADAVLIRSGRLDKRWMDTAGMRVAAECRNWQVLIPR